MGNNLNYMRRRMQLGAQPHKAKASGAVATFRTNLAAKLDSLFVDVTPVQDLHGQSSPYPAGGGKNLLPPINTQPESGEVIIEYPTEKTLNGFSISMKFSGSFVNAGASFIDLQDADGNHGYITPTAFGLVAGTTYTKQAVSYSSTEIKKIKKIVYFRYPNFTNPVFDDLMLEQGSTPTTFAPYENICPITGWTGCDVSKTGKNLAYAFNDGKVPSITNGKLVVANGYRTDYIPALPNTYYTLSADAGVYIFFYKSDKTFISVQIGSSGLASVKSPNETAFIMCRSELASQGRIMLEFGSTAHAYTPFVGSTIPISWQTEAGTVYGGQLEVLTGVLTVTHGRVDMGSRTWTYIQPTTSIPYGTFYNTIIDKKYGQLNILCEAYPTKAGFANDKAIQGNVGSNTVYLTDSSYEGDGTAVATAMSGKYLIYELATPVTYQLDPIEVKTLIGQNNLWADCGNVDVSYWTNV